MLLQFLVILIALVVLFIVFNSKKEKTSGKALSVFIFILILSICSKTINLERNLFNEGFNVSIPSDNEIENFENNRDSKNSEELNSDDYNNANSYLDKEEKDFLNSDNKKNNTGKNKNINSITELDSLLKNKQPITTNNKNGDGDNFTDNIQSGVTDSNQFSPSINFNFGCDENEDFSLNLKPTNVNDTFKNTGDNNNDSSDNNDNFNNTNIDGNYQNVKISNPENTNTFDPKIYDNCGDDSFQSIENMQTDYANNKSRFINTPQNSYERFQTSSTNNKDFKKTNTSYKYEPGMAYMPPKYWAGYIDDEKVALGILNDVNNFRRQSRCPQPEKDINTRRLPIGIMDPGTPIFAYEVASDGKAPKREKDAKLSNIGSILPKFSYTEYNSEVQYPNDKDLKKNNYYHDYSQNCTPYGLGGQDRRDRIPPANPEDN